MRLDAVADLQLAVADVGHIQRPHQLVDVPASEYHITGMLLVAPGHGEGVLGGHRAQGSKGRTVGTEFLRERVVVHPARHTGGGLTEHRVERGDALV